MLEIYKVNAFTKDARGGNPAGVVFNADALNEKRMLTIAKDLGFSETAYISKSDFADFKIRFFTPVGEVDLCGHATIASWGLMLELAAIKAGNYKQETKAGILDIEVSANGLVMMDQTQPIFSENLSCEEIAKALNVSSDQLLGLSPQIVSTGLRDILVGFKNREALLEMKPDFKLISALSKKHSVIGIHAFTLDVINSSAVAHCRNFAPLYGIDEEAATGTASGALASYLYKNRLIREDQLEDIIFEQGYSMGLASEIKLKLAVQSKQIIRVQVGGKATKCGLIQE